jgi:tetratricopeptide (TPR) repeat protein
MMPNRQTDILFQLIHTLEKAEKRHFKLYIKRSSARQDLKIVQLFDALDKLQGYDEKLLLKKLSGIEKPQLHNLKTHLYREILASLRLLKSADSIDLQLNEQFDYAHILYKKGLFAQSLRIVEKAKETARSNEKLNHLTQLIALEKRIETLHITRSMEEKTGLLSAEALTTSNRTHNVVQLSNLALQLYSWYIKNGHTRNEEDEKDIRIFFKENMPAAAAKLTGFYEQLYLYQSYSTFAFIRQDFLQYYRYSQKWATLFSSNPLMIRVETGHYIKALHNLMNAHFDLRNHQQFEITIKKFEAFAKTDRVIQHENFLVQTFIYIHIAKINQHFMQGTFKDGLLLVPYIEQHLQQYNLLIDRHRILVFNYKIACLYFGSGDYSTCIDYLQRIINDSIDLRYDLQCYARLLHLMAHYEMGNFDIIEHLVKSVYRFMAKMKNFTVVEAEMFKFLKHAVKTGKGDLKIALEEFLNKIKKFEKNRFETRSFVYMDVISWLESKVTNKPVSEVIHQKYLKERKRNYPGLTD